MIAEINPANILIANDIIWGALNQDLPLVNDVSAIDDI